MSEPRRILLTHFDLDGVACDIIISRLYSTEKKIKCGYAKAKSYIMNGALSGYDTAIVTDMSLTYNQFFQLSEEYGKKFLYIDHHKPSVDMVNGLKNNTSLCFVNEKFSGAGISYQVFEKRISKTHIPFITAVDAYDCWRWKTHPDNFKVGYNLNTLFWKYGYNDFYNRFFNNIKVVWHPHEKKWIDNHNTERDLAIKNADKTYFGNNSLVVLNTPQEYINDFGLHFTDVDIFYLLYTTVDGKLSLSVRTTLDNIDIGDALRRVKMGNSYINTAGGHPFAGGLDFNSEIDLDILLDIIESINDILENKPIEDLPF